MWRMLLLLTAIIFAAAATLHGAGGAHAASAALHPHQIAEVGGDGAPCSHSEFGHFDDTVCVSGGICVLCVPLGEVALLPHANKPVAMPAMDPVLGDRIAASHFRPPRRPAIA